MSSGSGKEVGHARRIAAIAIMAAAALLGFGASVKPSFAAPANDSAVAAEPLVITGRVTDSEGRPISGATIERVANKRFELRTRTTTDANGEYQISLEAGPGVYLLAASAPSYLSTAPNLLPVLSPERQDIVLTKAAGETNFISGVVVDEQGQPIAGVTVEARGQANEVESRFTVPFGGEYFSGPDRVATTDEQGRFRIEDLPTEKVQLQVRSKYRWVNDQNYPVQAGVTISMSGSGLPGVVRGRLVDAATGQPPAAVGDIRIVPRYDTKVYHTDADGRFQLPTDATRGNQYLVYVYGPGYAATAARLTAVAPDSADAPTIELSAANPLRGKLVDADTGQPVAGLPLLYGLADKLTYFEWGTFDKYTDGYHSLKFVQHEVSDRSGEFWFAEPPGEAHGMIVVFGEGYQRLILTPEEFAVDEATGVLVIRLKRESAFTGVVFDDGKPVPDARVSIGIRSPGDFINMAESVRTNAQGRYRIGRLSQGPYQISGDRYSRVAVVGSSKTAAVNLGDDLGPIRIHGKCVPNATITLEPDFTWGYTRLTAQANDAGVYEFPGLQPGTYVASVNVPNVMMYVDHARHEIEVKNDGQEIDLEKIGRR